MRTKLTELCHVIRSKNSGPYEITFDLMFKSSQIFNMMCERKLINDKLVCDLYQISPEMIINIIEFAPANAIKITIVRPMSSGAIAETDVYGAQQHAPWLMWEFDWN
jgi:hypothetical protein